MRMLLLLFFACLLSVPVYAQEDAETLIQGDIEHGGFGGPVVKFSSMNNESAVLVGGRGGWIINHLISLGGGGYGLASEIQTNPGELLVFGYGGFEMEYIIASDRLLHTTIRTLIGAGGLSSVNDDLSTDDETNGDAFFVLEPSVNAELNLTQFFRLNAGLGYRYISGVDRFNLSDADVSGLNATLTLKFGLF